ncbi:MAG: phospholipid/glycerol acyltransferase [Phycisphaerales bacterium]|nr:phospholipid/glycerol acyltransferase [Phycisphaerales bacterium]
MLNQPPSPLSVADHLTDPHARRSKLFTLEDVPAASSWGRRLLPHVAPALERLFGLDAMNAIHARAAKGDPSRLFVDRVLDALGVSYRISDSDLSRIPKTGPVVIVANHPFGALDGMILASLVRKVRPDSKVMANSLVGRVPEMQELFVLVDPFGGSRAKAENLGPMRQAIRWVRSGGLLGVFPAGEVAHLDARHRAITEPQWNQAIARIAHMAGAPVVPLYFDGRNSVAFQLLGLIHPRVRTAMLPRELLKKRGAEIEMRVGSAIPHRRLESMPGDAERTGYLRERTFLLRHRGGTSEAGRLGQTTRMEPVCEAGPAGQIAQEVAQLPATQMLAESDGLAVYHARAAQVPHLLREIGRLREITYRATGEGTGRGIDLDEFDDWYHHLFVWHKTSRELVGAYRLGATDEIVTARGERGLYTATLFRYRPGLIERLGPALELGRSFVRAEYQKSYAPLLMLWKGIGRFVVDNPQYKSLFGPVSISNDYQGISKELMVRFLEARHAEPGLSRLTQPRNPFRSGRGGGVEEVCRVLLASDDVDDLVSELEPDGKGIPVLMRQYLKLGARFFGFNVDPDFNDALDGLMLVDLTRTDRKLLDRYMGKPGAAQFLAVHGVNSPGRVLNPTAN